MEFEQGLFYFVQIIRRRKENPSLATNSQVISYFFLDEPTRFEDKVAEIIRLCDTTNARAYVHMARRSWKAVAFNALLIIAKKLESREYRSIKNAYYSACGQCPCEKLWLIDVDDPAKEVNVLTTVAKIPTKNGYHLLVKPFDRRGFDLEIKKDSPTLGYCP